MPLCSNYDAFRDGPQEGGPEYGGLHRLFAGTEKPGSTISLPVGSASRAVEKNEVQWQCPLFSVYHAGRPHGEAHDGSGHLRNR